MKIYSLNAFAITENGGNPAGVCLKSENLSEKQMQEIAAQVGYSETAFVLPSEKADFRVRFFTPVREVDLCGHATIATFSLMHQIGLISSGSYRQETLAGILSVEIDKNGTVRMEQNLPVFGSEANKNVIAKSLNVSVDSLIRNMPLQVVSTGLMDLIIPIKSLELLNSIEPDFSRIVDISRELGVSGYHLFTTETVRGSTAHCRNFAPLYEINEEAATGTATGATISYMYRHGMLKDSDTYTFEQGYTMNRPSEIQGFIEEKDGEICKIQIGGTATGLSQIHL